MNPSKKKKKKKQFTYKDISRLDKFLYSTQILDNVQNSNILIPGIKSDFKCVTIFLDLNKYDKSPGRWKMNTSIINDILLQHKCVFSYKDINNIERDESDITLSRKFNIHINW